MTIKRVLMVGALSLPLAGCATYQGSPPEDYSIDTGYGRAEPYPSPAASPTFRPGMNQQDPRDAHFTIQPTPASPAPTVQ
jgi:hypothetical protein